MSLNFMNYGRSGIFSKIIIEFFVTPLLFKDKKNPKLIKKIMEKSRKVKEYL